LEEEEFLEAIKATRKDFRKARKMFHKFLPAPWMELLEGCSTEIPKEKFQELVQKAKIGMAEAREKTIKLWDENLDRVFSMIKKGFQKPIKPKEIEERVLALIDLTKDAALFATEELKAIDIMEAGLEKVTKK